MNGERETPREIARGGPRLARTCLLGPPSFTRDRMPAYLIRFLTRCIRGCLHRVHVNTHFLTGAKVFVPCNEPPPPGLPPPPPTSPLRHSATPPLCHSAAPSRAEPIRRSRNRRPREWGTGTTWRGMGRFSSASKGQTIVHIILLCGPRRGRWGRQPGIAAVAHG